MAARWGAGEEILTACNLDLFATDTLNEVKGLDEESEATLLTALTEILDNVDDENLSPFDMLPDSDLLSGQKAREHSPLRRLLCLSRSPPEKDTVCNMRTFSSGKSLPRPPAGSVQRSDGEEEEDGSLTPSPTRQPSSPDQELLDWGGLSPPLPFSIESEVDSEGLSVSLGDLVRHMHPYCMAVCVDNGEGEQMLPEGGILLEVVDQGEHGEPILAIPGLGLPLSLLQDTLDKEPHVPEESDKAATESCEEIVVDDPTTTGTEMKSEIIAASVRNAEKVKCERNKKHKAPRTKEIKEKSPPRRKKDSKVQIQPKPVEGRILRSTISRNAAKELPQKLTKQPIKVKKSVPLAHFFNDSNSAHASPKPKRLNVCQTHTEVTKLTLPCKTRVDTTAVTASNSLTVKETPVKRPPSCPPAPVTFIQPNERQQLAPSPTKPEVSSTAATTALPLPNVVPVSTDSCSSPHGPTTSDALQTNSTTPKVDATAPEPKPKSLSLAEYRRLRQQKKPAPIKKLEDHSTKWPSLPEPPKELPPIPCLPNPSHMETRRLAPVLGKKEVDEVKPAWQPTGPGAPPTPEALLAPPAYMVASSTKARAATLISKRQQESVPQPHPVSKAAPPQPSSAAAPSVVKNPSPAPQTNASPEKPCVPQSSVSVTQSSATPSESKPARYPCQPITPSSLVSYEMPSKATTESLKTNATPMSANIPTQVGFKLIAATSVSDPVASASKFAKSAGLLTQPCSLAVQASNQPQSMKASPVKLGAQQGPTAAPLMKKRTASQALIEAFTSEIGIEAADLTSLLEQFEETQAKEKRCVPEVSGRAVAVGNSSVEMPAEKTAVERVKANDLSSSAALTPPATPPHQMWKPLAPVTLFGKSRATAEASRPTPTKVIQIEAQPFPSVKCRSIPAASALAPEWALMDHDYCLPNDMASPREQGKRWNVKQQPYITIRSVKQLHTTTTRQHSPASTPSPPETTKLALGTKLPESPLNEALTQLADRAVGSSVLETPDASPARQEADAASRQESPRPAWMVSADHSRAASRSPSTRSFPKERKRGRSRRRSIHRSSSSSESNSSPSRSRSRSPPTKRYRSRHSESSSSSSSCSSSRSPPRRRKYSYSSSRSGSWSVSRSRSRSPQRCARWQRNVYSSSYRPSYRHTSVESAEDVKKRKQQAIVSLFGQVNRVSLLLASIRIRFDIFPVLISDILPQDERRVVYVGRIRGTMTQNELRERFSLYGEIEDCTLHFREQGDNYGFVTYYDTKNAFTAIENGSKLRKPDELPFDLCFGGRRQFCKTSYADLDSNKEYESLPSKGKFNALDFDTLLKQAQKNQKR
ncbi:Peroxisome proliferator-activated receptor gamma coactivator-related protein 1 [Merluccius polli]|uniref:Peroxisome proliferator-activated receptor gamma coactivator-related protein 1 n=1 Tax=Merluccius polli TaxID=89951 RepID=A0AA47NSH7_MERPO|nr:Peroxisome proliferator-activated receptor gamma coactivator-related protein 1 [Merluccius polli]